MAKVTVRHGRLSYYSSLLMIALGLVTLLFISGFFGLILIVVGALMYRFARKGSSSPVALSMPPGAAETTSTSPVIAKEGQVVAKIPCKFCGTLNDQQSSKCESCGAALR